MDKVIEYSIDGGKTWWYGRDIPDWLSEWETVAPGRYATLLADVRTYVRVQAYDRHGEALGSVKTRVWKESAPEHRIIAHQ